MHGGAAGSGAPKGERNGNWRHGRFTCEAVAERRATRGLLHSTRDTLWWREARIFRPVRSAMGPLPKAGYPVSLLTI
jgi:hypothetical protein